MKLPEQRTVTVHLSTVQPLLIFQDYITNMMSCESFTTFLKPKIFVDHGSILGKVACLSRIVKMKKESISVVKRKAVPI